MLRLIALSALLLASPVASDETESLELSGQVDGTRWTETLRSQAGGAWESITNDPFTAALADGTLRNSTLGLYLVQDHRFLDAFIVLLASMISAPALTLADKLPGARFLGLIASRENTYFERSFAAIGLTPEQIGAPDEPETTTFIKLMHTAAESGNVGSMLAVLVVCEWSYETWGERVVEAPNLPFTHLEWIDLHRGKEFGSVVSYLRTLLDRVGTEQTEPKKLLTKFFFNQAVKCEQDFWDMARRLQNEQDETNQQNAAAEL
ncbi:hypothetical protein M885DRAFT_490109 [Pelagophyceae sp. CCMP2097]|nr:hypothetical protein M885DRAFT_490109 [Pelagophyceae sp. CCMP2097]